MNLLIINDSGLIGGGTENRIRMLLEEFNKTKLFKELHVLCHEDSPQKDQQGVIFHYGKYGLLNNYKIVKRILFQHNIDLVQAHNLVALTPFSLLFLKLKNIPIVWFIHDYWLLCSKRRMVKENGQVCSQIVNAQCVKCSSIRTLLRIFIYKKIINFACTNGIAASEFLVNLHEKYNILKNKWIIVHPWIDTNIFKNDSGSHKEKANKIVFTGPLSQEKGVLVAAEAMKIISKEVLDAKLYFFGDGQNLNNPIRKNISIIAKEECKTGKIIFGGEKSWVELKNEYVAAKVFICPPIWNETFGLNWAEAMACGCPVVASAIGSLPEFINNPWHFFPSGDAKQLAEKVIYLIKNPDYAEDLAKKSGIYAHETFQVKRAAKEIIEIYERLLI